MSLSAKCSTESLWPRVLRLLSIHDILRRGQRVTGLPRALNGKVRRKLRCMPMIRIFWMP